MKEDHSEAVDVGARVGALRVLGLLRRHVARGAEDRAGAGYTTVSFDPLGQAEIGDVRLLFGIDHDVRRL